MIEKIDDLVVSSSMNAVFVYMAGATNIKEGRVVAKVKDRQRRSEVLGILLQYNLVISKVLEINSYLRKICRRKIVVEIIPSEYIEYFIIINLVQFK